MFLKHKIMFIFAFHITAAKNCMYSCADGRFWINKAFKKNVFWRAACQALPTKMSPFLPAQNVFALLLSFKPTFSPKQ